MRTILLTVLTAFSALCLYGEENLPPELALVYPIAPKAADIKVDGDLSDAAWRKAVRISSFTDSGSPNLAIQQTTMGLCYDNDNLYIGVECFESSMKTLKTPSSGMDAQFWNDDSIEFFIDQDHSHEKHFQLAVTANMAKFDSKDGDSLWTKEWTAVTKKYADKWTVEIAIPFEIFERQAPKAGEFWGFNLCRERQAGGKLELFNWADVQRVFNRTYLFGHLLFMPQDWEANMDAIAKAAQAKGRSETHLQLDDGHWSFKPGQGKPRKLSFSEACKERFASLPPRAVELENMIKNLKNSKAKTDYEALAAKYRDWNKRAQAKKTLTAVEFAQANVFYTEFVNKLDTFYWDIKLAQLNESI